MEACMPSHSAIPAAPKLIQRLCAFAQQLFVLYSNAGQADTKVGVLPPFPACRRKSYPIGSAHTPPWQPLVQCASCSHQSFQSPTNWGFWIFRLLRKAWISKPYHQASDNRSHIKKSLICCWTRNTISRIRQVKGVCYKHILIHAGKGVRQGTGTPKKLCGVPHKNRPASNFTATEIGLTTKVTKKILLKFTLPGLSG